MRRFFTEPQNIVGNTAKVFEDSKHIEKVLRMKTGDEILIFDGSGYEYTAKLVTLERDFCTAEILSKEFSRCEPKIKITLFQGLPKSGKMELIVQKTVELGVVRIVPVIMERCVTKISDAAAGAEKAKRWNKISVEAAKQCGRGIVPQVLEPVPFDDAIDMLEKIQVPIMPYEVLGHEGRCDLKSVLDENCTASDFGIIVGPEGGFSEEEALCAKAHGIHTVGLGKRILRTETVASAVIPVIMYDRGEF